MKTQYLILVSFLVLLISSCSQNAPDEAAIRKEIRSVILRQEQGWNAGNLEEYMSGYDATDSVRFASGGSMTYGWDSTLQRYKRGYPDKAAMGTLTFSEIDVQPLSESSALVFGKWALALAKDNPWGYFTLIFKKTGKGWKIVHDHTSLGGK